MPDIRITKKNKPDDILMQMDPVRKLLFHHTASLSRNLLSQSPHGNCEVLEVGWLDLEEGEKDTVVSYLLDRRVDEHEHLREQKGYLRK